jgi:hypothetical protein
MTFHIIEYVSLQLLADRLKLQSKEIGALYDIHANKRNIIKLWRKSPLLTFSMEKFFCVMNWSFFLQILSCVLHIVYEFYSDPLSCSFLQLFFGHHCSCHPV